MPPHDARPHGPATSRPLTPLPARHLEKRPLRRLRQRLDSGLRKLDPAIADRFARQPWSGELPWGDRRARLPTTPPPAPAADGRWCGAGATSTRRPTSASARPSNLAGFEIIDCPALTSEGKTSTDIHMVLDIIDLLQHEAHYDEFIVFSADADFTPVLRP